MTATHSDYPSFLALASVVKDSLCLGKKEFAMSHMMPRMTDEEILTYASEYDENGFESMPSWLQHEMRVRCINIEPRPPTELEMWETVSDAREHRITNKELTIEDYVDKYKKGKSFLII